MRSAFQNLLADTAKSQGWILVPEQRTKSGGQTVIPDGTLRDAYNRGDDEESSCDSWAR